MLHLVEQIPSASGNTCIPVRKTSIMVSPHLRKTPHT